MSRVLGPRLIKFPLPKAIIPLTTSPGSHASHFRHTRPSRLFLSPYDRSEFFGASKDPFSLWLWDRAPIIITSLTPLTIPGGPATWSGVVPSFSNVSKDKMIIYVLSLGAMHSVKHALNEADVETTSAIYSRQQEATDNASNFILWREGQVKVMVATTAFGLE